MKSRLAILLVVALSCTKPKGVKTYPIFGDWQAYEMTQNDTISTVDLSAVRLTLKEVERFSFTNNLNQTSAGTFEIKDGLLLYTDTTVDPMKETAVHIYYLTQDTLKLRMNVSQKETILAFKRQ